MRDEEVNTQRSRPAGPLIEGKDDVIMFKTLALVGSVALIGLTAVAAQARGVMDHTPEQIATEKEAVQMIAQVEEVARDVSYHTERLQGLTLNFGVSRWSHYHHLDGIKELVNDGLRPALARLTAIETQLPEWKQESVDRMIADAQRLADDTSSAYIAKANGAALPSAMNDEYTRFVANVAAHAAALVKTADAAHSYATAHLKASEAGLNIPKSRPTN